MTTEFQDAVLLLSSGNYCVYKILKSNFMDSIEMFRNETIIAKIASLKKSLSNYLESQGKFDSFSSKENEVNSINHCDESPKSSEYTAEDKTPSSLASYSRSPNLFSPTQKIATTSTLGSGRRYKKQ